MMGTQLDKGIEESLCKMTSLVILPVVIFYKMTPLFSGATKNTP